jgi:hypothetical protein
MLGEHSLPHARAIVLVTLLAVLPLGAQSGPSFDLEKLRIAHETFVLDNGLTLVVHEDHSVPIVAVNLWYHVGSRNERRASVRALLLQRQRASPERLPRGDGRHRRQ